MRRPVRGHISISRLLVMGACLLLMDDFSLVSAQTGGIKKDPADVVRKYVSLDEKGARLAPMSFESQRPYISWTEEPVWGYAVVIRGVNVVDVTKEWDIISPFEAIIPVEYAVLGRIYWDTASFIADAVPERAGFRIKLFKDRWKIADPILPPHIARTRLLNFVRQALLDEKDPIRVAKLTELRHDLERLK